MRWNWRQSRAIAIALLASACSLDVTSPEIDDPDLRYAKGGSSAVEVLVEPSSASVAAGSTLQLMATVSKGGKLQDGRSLIWSSSNTAIATVSSTGLVSGVNVGGPVTITASTGGKKAVTGSASIMVDPPVQVPATVTAYAGDGQSATVGTTVATPPSVVVRDATGNPIPDISVTFEITEGRGALTGSSVVTDENGLATLGSWLLHSAGNHSASATVSGVAPATLTATGTDLSLTLQTGIPGENFSGLWASSSSDVFVSGGYRSLSHFNGTSWSAMTHPSGANRYRVFGKSSNDVYSVGQWNVIRYNGTAWSSMLEIGGELFGVWGPASAPDLFVSGDGTFRHYNGTTWANIPTGLSLSFNVDRIVNIWGTSASNVYAVGKNGILLHYDGTAVTRLASGTSNYLTGIHGTSASSIFAVGHGGTILHYDGTSWASMESGTTERLDGVFAFSPTNVYAGGSNGALLHYDGTAWRRIPTTVTGDFGAFFGLTPTRLYLGLFGAGTIAVGTP